MKQELLINDSELSSSISETSEKLSDSNNDSIQESELNYERLSENK